MNQEPREDSFCWVLAAGIVLPFIGLVILKLFLSDFTVSLIAQSYMVTVFCYGHGFYVCQRKHLGRLWLWKAGIASVPLHLLFLIAIAWADKIFPHLMVKPVVYVPALILPMAAESTVIDTIIDRYRPPTETQP